LYLFIVILPFFAFSIAFYAKREKMSQKVEKEKRLTPQKFNLETPQAPRFRRGYMAFEKIDLITGVFFSFRSKRCNKRACRSRAQK
jgi:hypothetical protein